MPSNNLKNEADHFDQMISGKSSEVIFYDSPFVKIVIDDLNEMAFNKLGQLKDKNILFYGCGANFSPIKKMIEGKSQKICAIDISPKSIKKIQELINKLNYSEFVFPEVMDCMELKYEDNTFDLVYGRAILHHLDLKIALNEIYRVLKPGGVAVFLEPLGTNPIINLFRNLTPNRRTKDEHPFTKSDFSEIERSKFLIIRYYWCNLLVNFGIFVATIFKIVSLDRKNFIFLKKMDDSLLNAIPFLKKFCWNIIITIEK